MSENNYITPSDIAERVVRVLGDDVLDPCSNQKANDFTHIASRYFVGGAHDDGLLRTWPGAVYVNPPGGQLDPDTLQPANRGLSAARVWWGRLVEEYRSGRTTEAIFMAFNSELLRQAQADTFGPLDIADAVCVPAKRLAFVHPDTLRPDTGNRYWSAICYLGQRPEVFENVFRPVGSVVLPRRTRGS